MIVSNTHKFIYIKNRKVAGTSVESFFQKYALCEKERNENPEYCNYSHYTQPWISDSGCVSARLPREIRGPVFNPVDFKEHLILSSEEMREVFMKSHTPQHATANEIRRFVGEEKFNNYFKFTVIRNPWDRLVSFWHHIGKKKCADFSNWVCLGYPKGPTKEYWSTICLENNLPSCDFFIRYENLVQDCEEVARILRIGDEIVLPNHLSGFREKSDHYSHFYNNRAIEWVERYCEREISNFGYTFEDRR